MEEIKELFNSFGIVLSDLQRNKFDKYFHMLVETNKNINLTTITEEKEVWVKHFLDSLLPLDYFSQNATVVDVGTGAGFPGLPLKIVRSDLKVTLVDSLNKRINFLKEVVSQLNLSEVNAVHSRAEDFAKGNREVFDFAVARAVAPLNILLEYLIPMIKVGGKAIIYKSSKLEEELSMSKQAINILGVKVLKVKNYKVNSDMERNVLIVQKVKTTPLKYPRDKNKPRLMPL
ncbi:MAG: 16S rRNA (guanine(527)-N(7))-methyltransferase RsmG [Clostridiales bacterium]|nr:16S rRNA (guanine(527)-N(7))-methyltransferase RsmG [Clostridiales bacterium]